MADERISIRIIDWEKYNPRKDVKNPSWFRCEHSLFESPDFFDFEIAEIAFWIYLLSLACKKNNEGVTVSIRHAEQIGRFPPKVARSALEKLRNIGVLQIDVTATYADVTPPFMLLSATNERTNERTNDISLTPVRFDFDSVYKNYPRKVGKGKGIQKLKTQIKTQSDFEQLQIAVDRFRQHHLKTEPQFIPHFSTWVTWWKDCLDPNWGVVQLKSKQPFDFDTGR